MNKLGNEFGNTVSNPNPYLAVMKKKGLDVYGCRAMDVAISIKADGSINLPCTGLIIESKKGSLRDIYYSDSAEELRKLQGVHPNCYQCSIQCMSTASAMLNLSGLVSIFDKYIKSLNNSL